MKKILIRYKGLETEAVLLARFTIVDNELTEKKGLFGRLKRCVTPIERQCCLVFLPWKHDEKELAIIPASDVKSHADPKGDDTVSVCEYVSPFTEEAPYYTEYTVRDFVGYKFVCDDKSLIANVKNQCTAKPLATLYKNYPELLSEETV